MQKAHLRHTTAADPVRVYSVIAATNTTIAVNKAAAAHPHAAVIDVSAAQQGKKTAVDLKKIKAAAANRHADVHSVDALHRAQKAQSGVDQMKACSTLQ